MSLSQGHEQTVLDADSTRSMTIQLGTSRGLSHSSGLEGPANAGDWLLECQSSQQQQQLKTTAGSYTVASTVLGVCYREQMSPQHWLVLPIGDSVSWSLHLVVA